jgi:5'-nucleotidase
MNNKPLILITNDDGYAAPGFNALINMVSEFARVVAVAPEIPQSGKSHAITMDHPLFIRKIRQDNNVTIYACSGTPTDCIKLAFDRLLQERPSLTLSGINHGSNSAISVIYSGTIGAAAEASYYGIPAIGLSLIDHNTEADLEATLHYSRKIILDVINRKDLPKPLCLNVNFPTLATDQIKGIKLCRQSRGVWIEEFEQHFDPKGREYYWLGGHFHDREDGDKTETDQWALENGYVSIVPVEMYDMTSYSTLELLKGIIK